jgi:hypothetical protein
MFIYFYFTEVQFYIHLWSAVISYLKKKRKREKSMYIISSSRNVYILYVYIVYVYMFPDSKLSVSLLLFCRSRFRHTKRQMRQHYACRFELTSQWEMIRRLTSKRYRIDVEIFKSTSIRHHFDESFLTGMNTNCNESKLMTNCWQQKMNIIIRILLSSSCRHDADNVSIRVAEYSNSLYFNVGKCTANIQQYVLCITLPSPCRHDVDKRNVTVLLTVCSGNFVIRLLVKALMLLN